jgi:hypothetical protein
MNPATRRSLEGIDIPGPITEAGSIIAGLVPPVRERFVPLLKRAAGFKGYCAFASEDGHVVSVTIFGDRLSAMRADAQVREWVVSNLRDLLPNPPETAAGETLLHEISKLRRDDDPAMFATIRMFEGVGPREEVLPLVREHVFLTITGAPGFRGYYAFLDEADTGRGVSVSLFDTREHAIEANAWVVSVMRERRIAPNPPRVMAGHVVIVAAADG